MRINHEIVCFHLNDDMKVISHSCVQLFFICVQGCGSMLPSLIKSRTAFISSSVQTVRELLYILYISHLISKKKVPLSLHFFHLLYSYTKCSTSSNLIYDINTFLFSYFRLSSWSPLPLNSAMFLNSEFKSFSSLIGQKALSNFL